MLFNEYRPVSYLVLMQSTVIGFGILATATMLKTGKVAVDLGEAHYRPLSEFVRDHGLWLLGLPALWAIWAVSGLRAQKQSASRLVIGMALLVMLFAFFLLTAATAIIYQLPV